ncbi:MAG: hypothetical protein AB7S48_14845 [Bacteroidales bacterium]
MKDIKNEYVKRTQKDYSISFKLSVVSEIERGKFPLRVPKRNTGFKETEPLPIGSENTGT